MIVHEGKMGQVYVHWIPVFKGNAHFGLFLLAFEKEIGVGTATKTIWDQLAKKFNIEKKYETYNYWKENK